MEKTPLFLATYSGNLEEVRKLLKTATAEDIHEEEDELLRVAAHKGHAEIVRELLQTGADVHCREEFPLREALMGEHYDVAEILLDYGADVNFECGDDPFLIQMVEFGNYDIVEFLLQNGANVEIDDGRALQEACFNQFPDIAKLLIDYGADIHVWNSFVLKEASLNEADEIVEILLDYGADRTKLHEDATPEMREYVPVNPRRVLVVGN